MSAAVGVATGGVRRRSRSGAFGLLRSTGVAGMASSYYNFVFTFFLS